MAAPSPLETQILQFLQRELVQGASLQLRPDSRLLDLGLMNSVSAVMLQGFVEKRLGVKLPRGSLTPENLKSPASVAALVERCRRRA